MYLSVRTKFTISFFVSLTWMAASIWVSMPWFDQLSAHLGRVIAGVLILFIAIVPGFMNAFMITSLLLDKRPPRKVVTHYPPLSILIAAYDEEDYIAQTIASIDQQQYPGELEVMVLDDGSRDRTAAIVQMLVAARPWLRCVRMPRNGGKARALNHGLALARHELVVTLDADSYLYRNALKCIVERYLADPPDTCAVAGTILVRNSRDNWLTKAQEWDYFQGIATVKRVQSLNQGTLVAQGAFSLYEKAALLKVGGWTECVGEDIVLTWAFLAKGWRVGYCEDGVAFTTVPTTLGKFIHQRQRWARGMIEAFKHHPDILFKPRLSSYFIWWDLAFPMMDLAYTFGFIPGLVLAMFGKFWIVGPMTLSLLPIAGLINSAMYRTEKQMFLGQGLKIRHNRDGFFFYMLPYGMLVQPAAVLGYAAEFLNLKKSWGTK
jgi:biofilm PGA synthesis N-glycosyltransferase PgaC